MPSFKTLSLISATIAALLFLTLLLAPGLIFWLFAVDSHESAEFIARRAAMLFLGLAVLNYLARNTPPSQLRRALSLGMASTMLGLALLGTVELLCGFAGIGIVPAILTETLLGLAYLSYWRRQAG